MKISVISLHIPSNWAHSINSMKHSQGFFNLGHHVEILTIQRFLELKNKLKITNIPRYYNISDKINIRYFIDKTPLFFRDSRHLSHKAHHLSDIFRNVIPTIEYILHPERKISEYCKKKKIDLAYCRLTDRAAFYNIINKIPTIIEDHYNYKVPRQVPRRNSDMNNLFKLCRNKCFKGIITVHRDLKKQFVLKGVPEEKVLILEDAVDLNKFNFIVKSKEDIRKVLQLPLNKKIVLYAGSLKIGKGIKTILDAVHFFKDKNYMFYILGGKNNEIKKWKKYIKNQHIKTNIKFEGFKENKLIPYYLKSADILLAPYSLKSLIIKWISPIKIFEYMASNVPIIASDVKRLREICNNGECLFFEVDNPEDLSEKIKVLINDEDLQKKIVKNAFKKVKKHTYIERCKKIIEFSNSENY